MGKSYDFGDLDADEFTVTIAWSGPEDKPFYRARLTSRPSEIKKEPFWGYVVIGKKEFTGILDVLQNSNATCAKGPFVQNKPTYYVEIHAAGDVYHCLLGFDRFTLETLDRIATALEGANRRPVLDIISRIRPSLG